jgi:hypothetical protein
MHPSYRKAPNLDNTREDYRQGIGVYFLIIKISLNSQEFSRKTNHKGE